MNPTPNNALEVLQRKLHETLAKICPGFSGLDPSQQTHLCDSFLTDLVAEIGIPTALSLTAIERSSEADITALTDLIPWDNIPKVLQTFYQKKVNTVPVPA